MRAHQASSRCAGRGDACTDGYARPGGLHSFVTAKPRPAVPARRGLNYSFTGTATVAGAAAWEAGCSELSLPRRYLLGVSRCGTIHQGKAELFPPPIAE